MLDKQDSWSDWSCLYGKAVVMRKVADNEFCIVYVAVVDGRDWCVRMNNFPDEPLYTLIIDNEEILHFNDWPSLWLKCNWGAFGEMSLGATKGLVIGVNGSRVRF